MATDTPFPTSSAETAAAGSETYRREDTMPGASTYGRADRPMTETANDTAARADDLIGRIAQTAHDTIDRLAESAAPHVNRLQENLSGDALHQRADQMREVGDEWVESLRSTVRENPLAAVGVALAVGLLVARLTR